MIRYENKTLDFKNKTIVLVYMLYFGDTVAITPFLETLRKEARGSKIILVMDGDYIDAVRYNPNIDDIIPVQRKKLGLLGTWKLGKSLREYHPDILFVLHGTSRTTLLGVASQAKLWIGRRGTRFDRLWMDRVVPITDHTKVASATYVSALSRLVGHEIPVPEMRTYSCAEWDNGALNFFRAHGIHKGDRLVGISVGSTRIEKDWPAERFGKVADYFAGLGYRPVFFGVERERELVDRAVKNLDCDPIIAVNELSMGEFIAAASWCSVAFTNDSGPLYVFDSRGVPTVSLFGPSSARNHYPMGPRSVALTSTDMPVGQDHVNHTIRDGNYVPIDHIPVDEVIRAGKWALGLQDSDLYRNHYVVIK